MKIFIFCLLWSATLIIVLNLQIENDKLKHKIKYASIFTVKNTRDSLINTCSKCGLTKTIFFYQFDEDTIECQKKRKLKRDSLYKKIK